MRQNGRLDPEMCNRRRLDGIPFLLENIRRILKMGGRTISDSTYHDGCGARARASTRWLLIIWGGWPVRWPAPNAWSNRSRRRIGSPTRHSHRRCSVGSGLGSTVNPIGRWATGLRFGCRCGRWWGGSRIFCSDRTARCAARRPPNIYPQGAPHRRALNVRVCPRRLEDERLLVGRIAGNRPPTVRRQPPTDAQSATRCRNGCFGRQTRRPCTGRCPRGHRPTQNRVSGPASYSGACS